MKGRWIMAIIAFNLLVLVALAFAYPHLMVSPGPLVPAHAALTRDCFACHAPLRGASSQRCLVCHALPDIGLRTTQGAPLPKPAVKASFHQQLIVQDCVACHADHPRPRFTTLNRQAFSHELLQPATRQRCEACHRAPASGVHRPPVASCSQCHQQQAWQPATFEHDRLFLLEGEHNATCVTCHTGNDYSRYTCYGCHEHTLSNVRAKHAEEGIRDIDNCVACHRSAGGEEGGREGRGGARKKD